MIVNKQKNNNKQNKGYRENNKKNKNQINEEKIKYELHEEEVENEINEEGIDNEINEEEEDYEINKEETDNEINEEGEHLLEGIRVREKNKKNRGDKTPSGERGREMYLYAVEPQLNSHGENTNLLDGMGVMPSGDTPHLQSPNPNNQNIQTHSNHKEENKDEMSEEEIINEINKLYKMRYNIQNMNKSNQVEILRILHKYNITINENKYGIHINMTELKSDVINALQMYIDYINKQEIELNNLEKEQENYIKTFFTPIS